jgi:AAA family ATP:ADP antiporter
MSPRVVSGSSWCDAFLLLLVDSSKSIIKLVACAGIVLLYRAVNNMASYSMGEHAPAAAPLKKKSASLRESVVELSKSQELRAMATMVVCYNACIELTEVLWKGILRKTYTNTSEYMKFMGTFSQTVGCCAFLLQLFASGIIRNLGWKGSALITPLSMGILAVPFFLSVAYGDKLGMTLSTALLIGTVQNVASKITKYSLFDPCKEMAYIPLGPEAKVKGKVSILVL